MAAAASTATAVGTEAAGEQRRRRAHVIAIDVHSAFCEGGWVDADGRERGQFRVPTNIPALAAAVERVPRPKRLVIEEGPLADWLCRHLRPLVDEMVSCDPWQNRLVSRSGEKSDALDWRRLAQLYRGGFVTPVHHAEQLSRSLFKQHVHLYHDRVRHRVSEALKVVWRVRQLGVMVREKDLASGESARAALLARLPDEAVLREDVTVMLSGYDRACEQVVLLRRRLAQMAKGDPAAARLTALPGVGSVRAATFVAIVDTPFRFRTKQKLWRYAGIGLERRQSGSGRAMLRVPERCNRTLKCVLMGAAKSAAASEGNGFADQYERWIDGGCSPRVARRNLARSLATVMWGMWKSGSAYDPCGGVGRALERVG